MKLRIVDKIFVALCGLAVLLAGVAMAAELFFGVEISSAVTKLLSGGNVWLSVAAVGVMLLLLIMAVCCFAALLRRRASNHGFVAQRTESGQLSISIRAIESLVQKCVDKHDDLEVNDMALNNTRDGLVIRLRVGLGEGVNIPLAVSALQKQIKQYVTACSGVDVREVRVQVENTTADLAKSVFAVPEMLENVPEQKLLEDAPAAETEESREEKLLHQRLFGVEEQPAIVPEPPVEEPAEEAPVAEVADEEQPAPAEEAAPAWNEAADAADEAAPAWDEAADAADEAAPAWDEAAAQADAADMVAEIDLSVLDVSDAAPQDEEFVADEVYGDAGVTEPEEAPDAAEAWSSGEEETRADVIADEADDAGGAAASDETCVEEAEDGSEITE